MDRIKIAAMFGTVFGGIFAALWVGIHVAGTSWAAPFACAVCVVALLLSKRPL